MTECTCRVVTSFDRTKSNFITDGLGFQIEKCPDCRRQLEIGRAVEAHVSGLADDDEFQIQREDGKIIIWVERDLTAKIIGKGADLLEALRGGELQAIAIAALAEYTGTEPGKGER